MFTYIQWYMLICKINLGVRCRDMIRGLMVPWLKKLRNINV